MADYSNDMIVAGCVPSQSVRVREKNPTVITKQDLIYGMRPVDLKDAENRVLIPGAKVRGQAETQYGVKEADH